MSATEHRIDVHEVPINDKQYCLTLIREDGTVVQLVASYFPNPFSLGSLGGQFDYYALAQKPGEERKVFTPENGPKDMNGMSVDEYIKNGRIGLMSVVRPHELIRAYMGLKEKLQRS